MPPRDKKNCIGKLKGKRLESEKVENVEKVKNKSTPLPLSTVPNAIKPEPKRKPKILQEAFSILDSTSLKPTENKKPLSFWSKKLKNLESFAVKKKETKLGMYEFIASEDSFLPKKKKIKSKKKNNPKKCKEFPVILKKEENLKLKDKYLLKKVKKDPIKKAISNKKINENKENNGIQLEEDKTKISYQMPSKFLTSTPASNKIRSLGTSNFIFLSPIKMSEFENFSNLENKNYVKFQSSNIIAKESNKIFTEKEEEVKCFKVLRNRKILIKN